MSKRIKHIFLFIAFLGVILPAYADDPFIETAVEKKDAEIDVSEIIMGHLGDAYEWHITTFKETHITIPLPIVVYSSTSGLNIFSSSHLSHGSGEYKGFSIAKEGSYAGKVVEKDAKGEDVRPWDISITKNTLSLMMSSILLVVIILCVARWYKRNCTIDNPKAPKGFVGFMELFIMNINDDVIKPCIGKNYKKFAPYLLTAFFFIFINNILGLIPIFPGGANVTGNIAITLVLALFTFFMVNAFGTKEYWKEIINPEVPTWLKLPIPIMPAIEIVGVFTKPFALMIRLFANILAGHSIILGLISIIFVTGSIGAAICVPMTFVSVVMAIFMNFVEVLVAYIQAYVFTMLSAVFIGLAQVEPHHAKN